MIKGYAILLIVFILTLYSCKNSLIWNENLQLYCEDFKKRKSKVGFDGMTTTGIKLSYRHNKDSVFVVTRSLFFPRKSWIDCDKFLLDHENRHFDITEMARRLLNKSIIEKSYINIKNCIEEIEILEYSISTIENNTHKMYDTETEHGKILSIQRKWNEKIRKSLDSLSDYKFNEFFLFKYNY